jgi:hypothetical protein
LGFVMQSGFPESTHLRHVERYLAKLAARLGSPYLGALIKGGGEGIRLMPDTMNRKLFDQLIALGQSLKENRPIRAGRRAKAGEAGALPGVSDPGVQTAGQDTVPGDVLGQSTEGNGVYEQRFAQPFKA